MNYTESTFATANLTLDANYYREFYGQWLRHVSKWRRLTIPFVYLCVVLSGAAAIWSPRPMVIAPAVFVIGLVSLIDHLLSRRKWLSDRLTSKSSGGEMKIAFTDDGVFVQSPFSEGTIQWAGIDSHRVTPRGIFLSPQKGASFYIPRSAIQPPAAISTIVARCG